MDENIKYYLILKCQVGKEEDGKYYLFKNGKWERDIEHVILDRLFGFDPSEPPGSPYGYGCTSIMEEIEEISYEKALELMNLR